MPMKAATVMSIFKRVSIAKVYSDLFTVSEKRP
jgi:hypothetical protein